MYITLLYKHTKMHSILSSFLRKRTRIRVKFVVQLCRIAETFRVSSLGLERSTRAMPVTPKSLIKDFFPASKLALYPPADRNVSRFTVRVNNTINYIPLHLCKSALEKNTQARTSAIARGCNRLTGGPVKRAMTNRVPIERLFYLLRRATQPRHDLYTADSDTSRVGRHPGYRARNIYFSQ